MVGAHPAVPGRRTPPTARSTDARSHPHPALPRRGPAAGRLRVLPVDAGDGNFYLDAVAGSGPTDVYVFGRQIRRYYGGVRLLIFHTADRGRTWTPVALPPDNLDRRVVAASVPARGELYLAGDKGYAGFIACFNGTSWIEPVLSVRTAYGIWSRDGEVFVAMGSGDQFSRTGGRVRHSRDRCATWTSFPRSGRTFPTCTRFGERPRTTCTPRDASVRSCGGTASGGRSSPWAAGRSGAPCGGPRRATCGW